jgi:hypothetical protein
MTERQAVYTTGPRFFAEGGKAMFSYRIDSACEIGPREATDADKRGYPQAWATFEASRPVKAEGRRQSA